MGLSLHRKLSTVGCGMISSSRPVYGTGKPLANGYNDSFDGKPRDEIVEWGNFLNLVGGSGVD